MAQQKFYFFIGTIAELIKVLPVMRELNKRGISFKIVSSGQNVISGNDLLASAGVKDVDIVINERPIRKAAIGLFLWVFETLFKGLWVLGVEFRGLRSQGTLIVHGDTVSTLLGAVIGKFYGLRVAHIEAGLRSHNFFQPFPEEIDRYLTAYFADVHFCPYALAVHNLRNRRGAKIDTVYNTNIDSLAFALAQNRVSDLQRRLQSDKYFIFIMHRQENLLNRHLVRDVVGVVKEQAERIKCIFVMHQLTRSVLASSGMIEKVERNDKIYVMDRMPYFEFVQLLNGSEFIVTDGGGNQQESYYLGKPCLLLRNVTEGTEGVGENALISNNDMAAVREFFQNYASFARPPVQPRVRPSSIIVDALTGSG